jgi:hypothetical protein
LKHCALKTICVVTVTFYGARISLEFFIFSRVVFLFRNLITIDVTMFYHFYHWNLT